MSRIATAVLATALLATAACDALRPTYTESTHPSFSSSDSNDDTDDSNGSGPTPNTISLEKIGGYAGIGLGAAEITAFDPVSKRLFVVNGALGTVDVLDLKDPSTPTLVGTISVTHHGGVANSVAAHKGVIAVAVEAAVKTSPGTVAFYRGPTLQEISTVVVGAQPDMVTFTPDGKAVLVANEGEPSDDYSIDPEGSISIIDVSNVNRPLVRTATFGAFNGSVDRLRAEGVRIYGPNATVAQDVEPEYITISDDGETAFVTLQEANALATVDIPSASVRSIQSLGFKDHLRTGNGIDASDRDNAVNIRNWPVRGMYQPDAIASYEVRGRTYLVTANEGDTRDWSGLREEARVSTLPLNPSVFTPEVCGGSCRDNSRLGRLTVTNQHGRNSAAGQFDALYVFGGRSISIWTENARQVWDSADELERRTSALPMVAFNASNDNNDFDNRSDNKGPEPEGVVLAKLGRKTFAFVGLERTGGVMVFEVSDPDSPRFVTYVNTRQGTAGDLGPEGLTFVSANDSPSKRPLLIVGYEISGTTAVFEIGLH